MSTFPRGRRMSNYFFGAARFIEVCLYPRMCQGLRCLASQCARQGIRARSTALGLFCGPAPGGSIGLLRSARHAAAKMFETLRQGRRARPDGLGKIPTRSCFDPASLACPGLLGALVFDPGGCLPSPLDQACLLVVAFSVLRTRQGLPRPVLAIGAPLAQLPRPVRELSYPILGAVAEHQRDAERGGRPGSSGTP